MLLVEDRPDLNLLFSLNLKTYVGANVHTCSDLKSAREYLLENSKDVDLVISKEGDDDYFSQLKRYVETQKFNIPIVMVEEVKLNNGQRERIKKKDQLANLLKSVARVLGVNAKMMVDENVPDFFPVSLDDLKLGIRVPCDVYCKSKNHHDEYIQLLSEGDSLLAHEIQMVKDSGSNFLFVKKDDRIKLIDDISAQLIEHMSAQDLTPEQKLIYADVGQQMVHETARNLGISDVTLQLADKSINSMINVSSKNETLKGLLTILMNDELSYRYKHCHLLTYISFHILQNLNWQTTDQADKLAMAAFFHDLVLSTDEMAKFTSDEQIDQSDLSDKDKKIVKNHALLASQILEKNDKIPQDVVKMVLQHHGSHRGIGLGMATNNILPLSALLMVAEKWTNLVLEYQDKHIKLNKEKVIQHVANELHLPIFKKFIPILETLNI